MTNYTAPKLKITVLKYIYVKIWKNLITADIYQTPTISSVEYVTVFLASFEIYLFIFSVKRTFITLMYH